MQEDLSGLCSSVCNHPLVGYATVTDHRVRKLHWVYSLTHCWEVVAIVIL